MQAGWRKGIPKASLWAHDQMAWDRSDVYTWQGFEFDYIGVIFGKDLVFNPSNGDWKGNPAAPFDSVVKSWT